MDTKTLDRLEALLEDYGPETASGVTLPLDTKAANAQVEIMAQVPELIAAARRAKRMERVVEAARWLGEVDNVHTWVEGNDVFGAYANDAFDEIEDIRCYSWDLLDAALAELEGKDGRI
jgi:hypothetical protein